MATHDTTLRRRTGDRGDDAVPCNEIHSGVVRGAAAAFHDPVERFDGRVVRAATLISVLHPTGGVLARTWTGPVAVQLVDGSSVELQLDGALVSGGSRSRRRIRLLLQVAADERLLFAELGYSPDYFRWPVFDLWVERVDLQLDERVTMVGSAITGGTAGGYRDRGRAVVGVDVRVLQSEVPSGFLGDALRAPRADEPPTFAYRAGHTLGFLVGWWARHLRLSLVMATYVGLVVLLLRWIGG